jgi:cellulose synthase/poly-beta-1,6-N-acetylglucosamine synthase-like glycosyltransferase
MDPDHVPRKNFLMRTLGYFKDQDVAFVVAPQVYGNI